MRTLILMRHAKSDWKEPGKADHDRPLNKRGRRATPLMAKQLLDAGIQADVILASSATRVQETLSLLQETWASEAKVQTEKSLYLATPQDIGAHIESIDDQYETAMVIGHNPGMCSLVCHLLGEGVDMPTAAVAVFQSEIDTWSLSITDAKWTLRSLWLPRELEADA